ncbi:MAG: cytochrome C, partial [Planctomycetota bacterium]
GIADGKKKSILKEEIELTKEMKASSMPEALTETIAPGEFLDLLAFLMGDWVATNPNLDYNLQAYEGWQEVSRQTHLQLGPDFPPNLNVEAQHLLSHEGVRQMTFAFHSPPKPSDQTEVVIRFNQPTELRHAKIFNRRDAKFHDRAKGITAWTSQDGKEWKKVWHSEPAYPNWSFSLPPGSVVKYVKMGLDRPGIFHLDRVTFYGKVMED